MENKIDDTISKIREVISHSCNKEGIAKKCPEKIAQAIYHEIVAPLEVQVFNLNLAKKWEDEKDSYALDMINKMLQESYKREEALRAEIKALKGE